MEQKDTEKIDPWRWDTPCALGWRTFACAYCADEKRKFMAVQTDPTAVNHQNFCHKCTKITPHKEIAPKQQSP